MQNDHNTMMNSDEVPALAAAQAPDRSPYLGYTLEGPII